MSEEIRQFIAMASAPSFEMLGKGYLLPKQTKDQFVLNPTSDEPRNVFADGSWIPAR